MKTNLLIALAIVFFAGIAATNYQKADVKNATVVSVDGYYLYIMSNPVDSFSTLGEVSTPGLWMSAQWHEIESKMMKRGKKEYPKADGFIVRGQDLTNWHAIKFK